MIHFRMTPAPYILFGFWSVFYRLKSFIFVTVDDLFVSGRNHQGPGAEIVPIGKLPNHQHFFNE